MTRALSCGLRLSIEGGLPGLPPDTAPGPPDATLRAGPAAPAAAEAALHDDVRLDPSGALVRESPDLRVRVCPEGTEAVVDAGPRADAALVRLAMGYAATSLLLLRRGGMPLHAAAAAGPRGAALFLGGPGAGKSTLATLAARRGMALVGDDLIALAIGAAEGVADGGAAVQPALRAAKLWPDSAARAGAAAGRGIGRATDAGAPDGAAAAEARGLEKDVLAWAAPPPVAFPAPLRAIFLLGWLHPEDAAPELRRLPPLAALPRLMEAVSRPALAEALGLRPAHLARAARIVATTPVCTLDRPRRWSATDAVLDLVEAAMG